MPKLKILQEDQSYSFRSYFEMPYQVDQVLAELGYGFVSDALELPKAERQIAEATQLQQEIEASLRLTLLSSETARREVVIAPILLTVARLCHCQIRLEYPLQVSNWLKGNLDYLLRAEQSFLVVEAKNDDLSRGFTSACSGDDCPGTGIGSAGDVWRGDNW